MAREKFLYIFAAIIMLATISCSEKEEFEQGLLGTEETWVTLDFGHKEFNDIEITTRATVGEIAESRVLDLYALLFVNDKCIYNQHFGSEIKKETQAEVTQAADDGTEECWWVQNRTTTTNTGSDNTTNDTHGTICMKMPTVSNGELYLIANANAYTVNISPELLGSIKTKADLESITAKMGTATMTRYGYFPMVAKTTNINVTKDAIKQGTANVTAELIRLDAKIDVNVTAAINATSEFNGVQIKVVDFKPLSWEIRNVPDGAYIIEGTDQYSSYFNSDPYNFESSTPTTLNGANTEKHSFSFYMLENKHTATTPNFHQRDKRKKNANGEYLYPLPETEEDEKDIWQYAPKDATYMIIKGTLMMQPSSPDNIIKDVAADVTYYVHLGDFSNNKNNNYSIERNSHYTYNITLKGVSNIEVEVLNDTENQSGATGDIYATQEKIWYFDAHYEQLAQFFTTEDIDEDAMSWYVKTPFGIEGSPKINSGLDYHQNGYEDELKNYDYKWLWFMINPIVDGKYDKRNQWYPGDQYKGEADGTEKRLMDTDDFVQYIREEKVKYLNGQENIFRQDENGEYGIAFTVYVDEFYYDKHPIDGSMPDGFWKQFVNKTDRLFHLYRVNRQSDDKESSVTNAVITIRQRSIQTPYNIDKASLHDGWGCEVIDETANSGFFFYNPDEAYNTNASNFRDPVTQNNSKFNGLYNTAILWGVLNNVASPTFQEGVRWDKYLDYERENEHTNTAGFKTYFLKDDYAVMRYAPMLRNRDSNGDRVIDASELKWYIASIDQLDGLYLGQLGLSPDAILYSAENSSRKGTVGDDDYLQYNEITQDHPFKSAHRWRNHVVSSTSTGGHPVTLWAEEGISVSNYATRHNKPAPYSIRCVRNLGIDQYSEAEARIALANKELYPTPLVRVIAPSSISKTAVYKFDLTNINSASKRAPTTLELEPSNEHDVNSRISDGFVTGELIETGTYEGKLYNDLIGGNSPSPLDWRVPNVRECAIMSLYCPAAWWDGYITTCSFYSNGKKGNNNQWGNGNDDQCASWQFGANYISIGSHGNATKTRLVQDWTPDE